MRCFLKGTESDLSGQSSTHLVEYHKRNFDRPLQIDQRMRACRLTIPPRSQLFSANFFLATRFWPDRLTLSFVLKFLWQDGATRAGGREETWPSWVQRTSRREREGLSRRLGVTRGGRRGTVQRPGEAGAAF